MNKSPPSESVRRILKPLLARMGVHFEYEVRQEGYYPRGGGEVELTIQPIAEYITPITLLKRSTIKQVYL